ncbi:MAG: hypothetical protein R3F30_07885 [Planctomycetota bacterium]
MKPMTLGTVGILCLAGSLSAQKYAYHPSNHEKVEGYSYETYNHVSYGISRVQYHYENWDLAMPKGAKIDSISMRQDGNNAITGYKLQYDLSMGLSSKTMDQTVSTFDSNYDSGTKAEVVAKTTIDLPSFSKGSVPSQNWVEFKFAKPFIFDNTKNLAWDIRIYANSNGNKNFPYYLDYAQYLVQHDRTIGQACSTGGKAYLGNAILGSNWNIQLQSGPASVPTILFIGGSKTKLLGVIPLPFSLDPLGMKGCSQYVDISIILTPGSTNTSGNLSINLPVPLDFKLRDGWIYTQWWAVDIFANNAGLVSSAGAGTTFGAYPRQTMLVNSTSATATTGSRYTNRGLVTRFGYQ